MQSWRLRFPIDIERKATGCDAAGQPLTGWENVASVFADIRPASGWQSIKADAESSITKASIRIRSIPGIDAGMRVVHSSTVYDIKAIIHDPKRVYCDLVCEAAT